jgi:hypothetical protein
LLQKLRAGRQTFCTRDRNLSPLHQKNQADREEDEDEDHLGIVYPAKKDNRLPESVKMQSWFIPTPGEFIQLDEYSKNFKGI